MGTLRQRGAIVAAACWLVLVLAAGALAAKAPAVDVEDRSREIASELRCVVCQNLSVADSPSDLAKEMRGLVREQVEQGKSRQDVLDYFVSRYGEYVLLSPPKRGFNLLVWGLPFVGLLAGAYGVYVVARRWTMQPAADSAGPPADPAYAERVRREIEERERREGN